MRRKTYATAGRIFSIQRAVMQRLDTTQVQVLASRELWAMVKDYMERHPHATFSAALRIVTSSAPRRWIP